MPTKTGTKINILDTNKKIGEEFLECLRQRNIPSKFAYWGNEETRHWLDICKDPEYINWTLEVGLLEKNLPEIISLAGTKVGNLVCLGIGNGEKDKRILNAYLKTRPMRYFSLDNSLPMVKAGFKTLSNTPVEKTAYIGDFKHIESLTPKIRKQTGKSNLISILGNTLGNLNQVHTLNLIRRSMDKNDYLLVSFQILEAGRILEIGEILGAYNTKTWHELSYGTIMRSGLKKTDGLTQVEFGKDKLYPQFNIIEFFFSLKKDKTVKYGGREVDFKAGERILTYYSYKYDEKNINFLLKNNGFKLVKSFFAPGNKYLLALAKLK